MGVDVAFLQGVNLGKRQMKMADLKACLEEAGFEDVKTVLASGNVRFARRGPAVETKNILEETIEKHFGFHVGVVIRSGEDITAMLKDNPFASLAEGADVARHVLFFDKALPEDLKLDDRPGDTEILRIDPTEIYIAAYRQPNGRYTEGVEEVLKRLYTKLGKTELRTMRNWNTIEKVLK
jgi:uncharacterized protein (DUF1697 family)